MISKSLENVANCAYAKSPSLEGSNEGDLPHLGFQRLTCMLQGGTTFLLTSKLVDIPVSRVRNFILETVSSRNQGVEVPHHTVRIVIIRWACQQ